ncbi:MAG: hypothetical protein HC779_06365 [Phyllobacteriaceae bacterium]|nr:hypothetical protein [Phyllobacteriaceae bacterium]
MLSMLNRFIRNKSGNFAIIAAVTFPAIFAGVATAIDLTNTVRTKTELQNAMIRRCCSPRVTSRNTARCPQRGRFRRFWMPMHRLASRAPSWYLIPHASNLR